MKKKKRKRNAGREYVLIMVMFVVIFVCFGMALTTISYDGKKSAVNVVSAFDFQYQDGYSFVENGVRYYVITKNDAAATTATGEPQVTEAAATTATTAATATTATTPFPPITVLPAETTNTTTATTAAPQPVDIRRVAYLTFDDGPSENTETILDILDQYNVKATFFVIYHKNMEDKYREIVERGHTIALHSYTHNYKRVYASEEAYFNDLTKIHDYVYNVTGVDSHIVRFPGGSSNTVSNKYCKGIMDKLKVDVPERGYIYHDWNVDSTDASGNNRAPEVLLAHVQEELPKVRKANVLMHDTGKMKQTTVEALPSIIEYVQSQGYEMERITEDSKVIQHH